MTFGCAAFTRAFSQPQRFSKPRVARRIIRCRFGGKRSRFRVGILPSRCRLLPWPKEGVAYTHQEQGLYRTCKGNTTLFLPGSLAWRYASTHSSLPE